MLFSYTSESSDVQDPQAMENSESGEAAMDVEDDFTAVISTSDTPIVEKPKKEEKGGTRGFSCIWGIHFLHFIVVLIRLPMVY